MVRLINAMVKEMGNMFRWFRDVGYGAEIDELRRLHPGVKTLAVWLETESAWKGKGKGKGGKRA